MALVWPGVAGPEWWGLIPLPSSRGWGTILFDPETEQGNWRIKKFAQEPTKGGWLSQIDRPQG